MALDQTPGVIVTKTRDQIRDKWTQDYKLRVPAADVGPGTQPFVDGSTAADAVSFLVNDAVVIGNGTNLETSAGAWLSGIGKSEGIFKRPAVGASGFVQVAASAGGGTILAGTEIAEPNSGLRFQCTATALYADGAAVPITGIDTGPATNFPAGPILQGTAPPPGIGPTATVLEQSDGEGLSGGREADTDEDYRLLIAQERANPPASGNDAEYQKQIQATPGIAVERAFTTPAILGPGTIGAVFTMRPSRVGASRIPNAAEIAAVEAYVVGLEPADDSLFLGTILAQPTAVALRITWAPGAQAWADVTQWPAYIAADEVRVLGTPTPTATTFRLHTDTATTTPQAGQTIGFLDATNQRFVHKRILSVSVVLADKTWDITVDTSNNASNTTYTPFAGQYASPWSPSLTSLVLPVLSYFDQLGPGEQVASFADPGTRQRRQPPSPGQFPSVINNRLIAPFVSGLVSSVTDAVLLEPATPYSTTVGTPGVLSYLITLSDLAAFA